VGYLGSVEEPGSFGAGNNFERHGADMCALRGVCIGHTFAPNSIVRFPGIIPRKCKEEKIEAGDSGWRRGRTGLCTDGALGAGGFFLARKAYERLNLAMVGSDPRSRKLELWHSDF